MVEIVLDGLIFQLDTVQVTWARSLNVAILKIRLAYGPVYGGCLACQLIQEDPVLCR